MSFSDLLAFHIDFHFVKETLLPYLFFYDCCLPPSSTFLLVVRNGIPCGLQGGHGRIVAVALCVATRQQAAFVIDCAWQADLCVMHPKSCRTSLAAFLQLSSSMKWKLCVFMFSLVCLQLRVSCLLFVCGTWTWPSVHVCACT